MSPGELNQARQVFGLGRKDFGTLIGIAGEPRNVWITIKRYETGEREIPGTVARLVMLLLWYKSDCGYLPDLDNGRREPMEMPEEFNSAG